MRSGGVLVLMALLASFIFPFNTAAADVLPVKVGTVTDFDQLHQAFDYPTGVMVPSGGDFWIADSSDSRPQTLAHVWEAPGIMDMGAVTFNSVSEAPGSGYQVDVAAGEGHTYVTFSRGKYGKFHIDDILKPGGRPGLTVTEFSITYAYQPTGSRNLATGATPPPVTPPVVTPPPASGGYTPGTVPPGGGLYENYKGSPDIGGDVRMQYWHGQTFTALSSHEVSSVKLLAYRIGNPGTLSVSLRAANSSGHPSGPDLASGSTSGDTLPLAQAGEWREITFSQPLNLSAGVKYAIVARAPGGGGGNAVKWQTDSTSTAYAGGNRESSGDAGAIWQSDLNADYLFELWGPSTGSSAPSTGSKPTSSGCNWTGTWDTYDASSIGGKYLDTLYFQQVGNQVTVTYKNYTYRKIIGTVSGNVLTGTWGDSQPYTQGIVEITISTDCNSITGRWRWPTTIGWEGTWVGTRQSTVLPQPPPATTTPPSTSTGAGTRLVAESRVTSPGDTVLVPIRLENAQGMGSLGFTISYDPDVIQYVKADKGAVMPTNASFVPNSPQDGTIILAYASSGAISGSGWAAQLEFKAVGGQGSKSALTLSEITATGSAGGQLTVSPVNGQVTIGQKIKGDGNGDGQVTVLDALMALKMYVKAIAVNLALDVNNDGKVTPEDARQILKMAKPK